MLEMGGDLPLDEIRCTGTPHPKDNGKGGVGLRFGGARSEFLALDRAEKLACRREKQLIRGMLSIIFPTLLRLSNSIRLFLVLGHYWLRELG